MYTDGTPDTRTPPLYSTTCDLRYKVDPSRFACSTCPQHFIGRKYPRLQAAAAASKMRPCEVSLIEQHRSPSNRGRDCVKEKNFGCTDGIGDAVNNLPKHDPKFFPWLTTMETVVWIGPGCRGI